MNSTPLQKNISIWKTLVTISVFLLFAVSTSTVYGFSPDTNNEVKAIEVQPDGKILVGGWFTTIEGRQKSFVARLFPNGKLDESFAAAANERLWAIALQPDGKVLIGGVFTSVNGVARVAIARVNANGTVDESFNANVNAGAIFDIAVQPDG